MIIYSLANPRGKKRKERFVQKQSAPNRKIVLATTPTPAVFFFCGLPFFSVRVRRCTGKNSPHKKNHTSPPKRTLLSVSSVFKISTISRRFACMTSRSTVLYKHPVRPAVLLAAVGLLLRPACVCMCVPSCLYLSYLAIIIILIIIIV